MDFGALYMPGATLKKKAKGVLKLDLHVPADQSQTALLHEGLYSAVIGHMGQTWICGSSKGESTHLQSYKNKSQPRTGSHARRLYWYVLTWSTADLQADFRIPKYRRSKLLAKSET
ncbi:hypothetical protein ABBQ32_007528 [Trebouxia sp. C0010 RCD-2024]